MIKTYIETRYFDPYAVPFYVEDVSGQGGTLTVNTSYSDATNVEFSTDAKNWSSINPGLAANGRVYIRANATYWHTGSASGIPKINSNNNFSVGGNIMSLLYYQDFKNKTVFPNANTNNIFFQLICNTRNLISAEQLLLPATTLNQGCYNQMFRGCVLLTSAPALPATTLAQGCYSEMFYQCTSLTTAPALPATTLAVNCYYSMFERCSALTTAPALPATTLAQGCYQYMFKQCTSLTAAPALPAPYIPWNIQCYQSMFNGCTSLSSVTVGATSWNTTSTLGWLNGVSATGTFTKPSATTIPEGGDGIPAGWTVINV